MSLTPGPALDAFIGEARGEKAIKREVVDEYDCHYMAKPAHRHYSTDPGTALELLQEMPDHMLTWRQNEWRVCEMQGSHNYIRGHNKSVCLAIIEAWAEWKGIELP